MGCRAAAVFTAFTKHPVPEIVAVVDFFFGVGTKGNQIMSYVFYLGKQHCSILETARQCLLQ